MFSGRGEKFTEALEREVEAIVADASLAACRRAARRRSTRADLVDAYLAHLARCCPMPERLRGIQARRSTAPTARRRRWRRGCSASLGFDVDVIGDEPDGRNINLRLRIDPSGAAGAHGRRARLPHGRRVRRRRRPRDLRRSTTGAIVDGDAVLLMCARQLQRRAGCKGNAIVATVMSNIGLELALRDARHRAGALRRSATST